MEALDKLNDLIDESDPDIDLPNIIHAFQTAERIRLDHPDNDWFQLVGLVHDLGKVIHAPLFLCNFSMTYISN
jgi:inositol oxygenase